MAEQDAAQDRLYQDAVRDPKADEKPRASEGDAARESNSSNYGGSALADTSLEDRVLHDD